MNLSLILSGISLALCVLFWLFAGAYLKKRTGEKRILAEFREEIAALIKEIDMVTDRDSLLIEERAKRLKTLLEDVDKRIATYTREVSRGLFQEAVYTAFDKKAPSIQREAAPPLPSIRVTEEPIKSEPPLTAQAVALAKAGLSPSLIANRLGMSRAEVDLALALSASD
ncbi:MAG: hypothetical protein LBB43_04180 [Spirochaetaceae bacterium]|jgi:uncharacterized protein YneF (UPF0154 family)|nr:hypothetical protein [Spirochaetaceae bacterium]